MALHPASINKFLKISLLFILGLTLYVPCYAHSFELTPSYNEAYLEILRLRFDKAENLIRNEKLKDPDNAAYAYFDGYIDFLKYLLNEESTDYEHLSSLHQSRLNILNKVPKASPWHYYSQGQANLQNAIAAIKAGNYLKAASYLRQSYNLFQENERRFPSFLPAKAGNGLMHILFGSVPDSYRWITNTLGFKGDVYHGIDLIYKILEHPDPDNSFLYNECLFLCSFITSDLSNNPVFSHKLANLFAENKNRAELKINLLLTYGAASLYINNGENDEALKLLINRPDGPGYYKIHYLDYLTGTSLLNKMNPSCRLYLLRYVNSYKGTSYVKSAYQKLAWSYLIDNDLHHYNQYISRALIFGNSQMENDKEAYTEAKTGVRPHINLLKARLLFDGGYYTESENALHSISVKSLTSLQKTEYYYRFARIKHKTGQIDDASTFYLNCLQSEGNSSTWFGANSLLQLGLISESQLKYNEAKSYFNQCLDRDFPIFRNSIHQKAKAGLSRLKD
jgi:hypothetical protein